MRKLLIIVAALLLLAGCGRVENPYQVDTVVRIPVDPTEAPTEIPTEAPETEAATEPPATTEAATEPEATEAPKTETPKKNTSTKKSSSNKTEKTKVTEPPATQPPETEAPTEPEVEEETAAATEPPYDPSSYVTGNLEKSILDQMNAHRREAGLDELTLGNRLSGIAALRGEEASEVWSHTRPDGRNFKSVLSDYDVGYSAASEHLVYVTGSGDAEAIVTKWMNADNREDILGAGFTKAGIGVYRCDGLTYVAVLLIG